MIKMYSMEFFTNENVSVEEYKRRVAVVAETKPACVSPDITYPVVHVLYRTENERNLAWKICSEAGLNVKCRKEAALVDERYFPTLN